MIALLLTYALADGQHNARLPVPDYITTLGQCSRYEQFAVADWLNAHPAARVVNMQCVDVVREEKGL